MSDDSCSNLLIGRIDSGYIIVVAGRGTCRESAAVQQFATETLTVNSSRVMIDLSACDYLDSTFLGCLVHLHKRFGGGSPPRVLVIASPERVKKLLVPSQLDKLLEISNDPVNLRETLTVLSQDEIDQFEMGRHVMECHRLLAELGGPSARAFANVADQLEREIGSTVLNTRPTRK